MTELGLPRLWHVYSHYMGLMISAHKNRFSLLAKTRSTCILWLAFALGYPWPAPGFMAHASALESASTLYQTGSREYDPEPINKALSLLQSAVQPEEKLLKALCYWKLQLISHALREKRKLKNYGKQADAALQAAQESGADLETCLAHRCLVYQLMATTGTISGARYGPKSALIVKKLKEKFPNSYYTRLLTATNKLEAPAIVGGDPQMALGMLRRLCSDYPDSVGASINLAVALRKTGNSEGAKALLNQLLLQNPRNLPALRIKNEMEMEEQ